MTTADPGFNTPNYEEQGGARLVIGGEIDIVTGGKLKVNGADVTSSVAGAGVAGAASGYKLARGSTAVTGAGTGSDTDTGLATVVACAAVLGEDISTAALWVTAALSATPGHITLKVWKPTATGDCTPIAATAAKTVNWVAIGT